MTRGGTFESYARRIALGCGYARQFSAMQFKFQYDYDRQYSWWLGNDVDNSARSFGASWGDAKAAVLFPSPFADCRTAEAGCDNSAANPVLSHFVAYVEGAAGNRTLGPRGP